jgi:hypothetical protein
MSVTTTASARRLHAVPDRPQAAPAPAVLEHLDDLEALHETAADVYDGATAELEEARRTLQEAAWALTEAEEAWSKAGAEMNDAARALAAAREAAGVSRTASGYRLAAQS